MIVFTTFSSKDLLFCYKSARAFYMLWYYSPFAVYVAHDFLSQFIMCI